MLKKPVAFSVRFLLLFPKPTKSLILLSLGVGDGIGRVWGLRNVQGQRDLF